RIIPGDLIEEVGTGTHALPLSHLIDFLAPVAGAILFIGIQPGSLGTGDPLSEKVEKSADEIVRIIGERRLDSIRELETGKNLE
ncbi:MAG TPA: hydrogenase 3 maturation endopeptidase HyCI, partial [Methanoregulaceae archaeon]|nr:hydrogenase 3 maturation endopeptidase HyCI [Methanoregulaceae archaeon]